VPIIPAAAPAMPAADHGVASIRGGDNGRLDWQ